MKNISFLILGMVALLSFNSCSKDDTEVTADFFGKWKLKEVNFIDDQVETWHTDTDSTSGNLLGWAPYMYSQVIGYELLSVEKYDEKNDFIGNKSVVVVKWPMNEYEEDYWVWNEVEKNKTIKIEQISNYMPYDFSFTETYDLKKSINEGKDVLEFTTTVTSVEQGKINSYPNFTTRPTIQVKAGLTLERMTADEEYEKGVYQPTIKLNGKPFELPEVKLPSRPNM